ncbi:MAG: hypothetical protein LC745_04155, partial [Planctomycetia bacterium]|nr:hypothetical protein [Planctomycetia bacterium]
AELARAGLPELAGPRPKGERAVGRRALAKAAARRARALACPSPFVVAGPRGRPCGLHAVCPHCWARRVERLWRSADEAMFQTPEHRRWERARDDYKRPKDRTWSEAMAAAGVTSLPPPVRPPGPDRLDRAAGLDLVEWVTCFDAPLRAMRPGSVRPYEMLYRVLEEVTGARVRGALYGPLRTWGALDAPVVAPTAGGWHTEVTRLLVVPSGAGTPPDWEPLLRVGEVRVLPCPTRGEVLEAVALACRYPPGLLDGEDPGRVVDLLEGRRGKLVFAAYGEFGGRGTYVLG